MSIVKMQKIAVIGHDTCKRKLIDSLMRLEAMEITDRSSLISDESLKDVVRADECREEVTALELQLSGIVQALDVIERYGELKNPLFKTRRAMPEDSEALIRANGEKARAKVERLIYINEELRKANEELNRLTQDEISLMPWLESDLPLELSKTESSEIVMGIISSQIPFSELESALNEKADLALIKSVSEDKDYRYIVCLYHKDQAGDVGSVMKQYGLSPISFTGMSGTAKTNQKRIEGEKEKVLKVTEALKSEVRELAKTKSEIEDYHDVCLISLDKLRVRSKFLRTDKAFYIEGWIPVHSREDIQKILDENECFYEIRDPKEGEEVPVLLKNKRFFKPIEAVTEMYSLPAYGSFDPTSIYALFYICFFGMMFSDACYGIIMAVACGVVLKKFDLEGTTYKMVKGFFYCGISTFFWGVMFGGWFGNFFEVVAETVFHKTIDIKPLWYDPLDDPLSLLIFSIALGVVHIFIGMGIKAYMQIREGHLFDAICDEGFWYLTIIGGIMLLAGSYLGLDIASTGKWLFIVGALGLLLTGGRDRKGFGKVIGGLSNLYNITSYMSDILSYSRILALGLATGVIAQVVNTMGSLFGGGALGCIFLLVVFVVGQTLNFAINVLGAFIHASRLQYVEFFGKFYEDGGEAFSPFKRNTKYIRLENN